VHFITTIKIMPPIPRKKEQAGEPYSWIFMIFPIACHLIVPNYGFCIYAQPQIRRRLAN
jgi:hypothetical protein